jgi:hypothetical protein
MKPFFPNSDFQLRSSIWISIVALLLILPTIFLPSNLSAQTQTETQDQPNVGAETASVPAELIGEWSVQMENDLPAWMSIEVADGKPVARMRLYVGGIGPYDDAKVEDGRVKFSIVKKFKKKNNKVARPNSTTLIDVGLKDGKLDGLMTKQTKQGKTLTKFTGAKIAPMPTEAPDLSKVKFGERVTLFNGKDLTGWTAHEADKKMGWSVVDGLLQNDTPKTDFSATGAYANLKTTDKFEDFRLHIEFNIGKQRNSGVYLRGMYEAQVVDRDSRMQGIQGVGAVFGAIEPTSNAGKEGGQWQTYDITLVNRHITVVLNGVTVVDNKPIARPTPGAIHTNPMTAGPIYLQGDHTSVSYRNIYLEPVVKE